MLKLLQKHLYIVYFTLFNDNMINQSILVAVDSLIFTILNNQLSIVLVERTIEPYKDMRAIPGGFVLESESLEEAAKRKLADEAGVNNAYMEQLYTFGNLQRDPRGRVVSCAYVAVIAYDQLKLKAWSDTSQVKLFPVKDLPAMAFDHAEIISYALQRLRSKIMYTDMAKYLLPKQFTLSQLQSVYENILGELLDSRNFRKKILKLDIIRSTGLLKKQGISRPAELFEFVDMGDLLVVDMV